MIIKKIIPIILIIMLSSSFTLSAQEDIEFDKIKTEDKDIELWFIGHGTLMIKYDELVLHIDPWSSLTDYKKLPPGELILITHSHGYYLDPAAIKLLKTNETVIICNESSAAQINDPVILANGESIELKGIKVEAVPAYNIKHERSPGNPFHPKGEGNGYILTIGGKRIYIGGDTENIPEMAEMDNIHIAFLPVNTPYTMTPEMAASAALMINPDILYPYHFGSTDLDEVKKLLEGKSIEIRIRKLN